MSQAARSASVTGTTTGSLPRWGRLAPLLHRERVLREVREVARFEVEQLPRRLRRREDPALATVNATVQRPPPARAAAATRRSDDAWPPAPRLGASYPHGGSQTHASPQIDLRSVTNQVMRQIDRRLIAWRERTGRV